MLLNICKKPLDFIALMYYTVTILKPMTQTSIAFGSAQRTVGGGMTVVERVLEWTAEGEPKAQASRGDVGCTLQQIMYVGT